jgi:hypothetical protein
MTYLQFYLVRGREKQPGFNGAEPRQGIHVPGVRLGGMHSFQKSADVSAA